MNNITELKPNQIFVFGSNLAGQHLGGAAKQAYEQFGAVFDQGEGLMGQSYAFPTLDKDLRKLDLLGLRLGVTRLYKCCGENPDKIFLLTKVGTGIAGYPEEDMRALFIDSPKNLIKHQDWI